MGSVEPLTFWKIVRRIPFTLLFLAVMFWANAQAGTFWGALPSDVLLRWGIAQSAVLDGELWRVFTATFLSHDPGMLARQFLFAASVIGYTEYHVGAWRAALLFFGLDVVGTLLLMLSIAVVPQLASVTDQFDVGMSMGGFGLIGYVIARMRYSALLLLATVLAIGLKIWLSFEPLVDTGHVIALLLGASVGAISQWYASGAAKV